jgi:hypothetical protein
VEADPMNDERRLQIALLALRAGVALMLSVWVADKFVNPGHGSAVLQHFYGLSGVGSAVIHLLGAVQAIIVVLFALGLARRWSYAAVLLMHGASTLLSFRQYLDPWSGANLLFFAAWPMLAACLALYLLRDRDRLLSLGR